MKEPYYSWDENTGTAGCIIYYKGLEFAGGAVCHKDDKDMQSKFTGQTIAETRALLKYCRHIRDNEIMPELKALKQFYYSINKSKFHNPKSYETKMLYRQIQNKELDLKNIRDEIKNLSTSLNKFIKDKEKSYQMIRTFREAQKAVKND